MAAAVLKTQKIVSDTPNDEVVALREQFNALLSVLANLADADVGLELKAALEAAGVKYVAPTKNYVRPRRFAAR